MKNGLKEILFSLSPGTSTIPLSNVKRLFRSRYHTELSETALGHSKLSELLQDPKLKDICHVRLQGHGYVVGPATPNMHHGHGKGQSAVVASYQSTHQQPLMQVPVAPAPQGGPKCNMAIMHTNLAPHMGGVANVHHVSAAAAGAVVASQAMRDASRAEPKGKFYANYEPRPDLGPHPGAHPHPVHPGLCERSDRSDRPSLNRAHHFVQPLSMEDVEAEAPQRMPQVPWKPPSPQGTLRSRRDHFEANMGGLDEMNLPGVPNTPLPLMPATPDTPGFPKWSNRAPDGLSAYSVQNTFINYPMPPPTPCQGRSQSLPRNLYQRSDDEGANDWSKSEALSQHPANRLMSAAAAAADPLAPNQKVPHPISAAPQPSHSSQPGFHPQNYTNPGASTIRLADLL